MFPDLRQIHRRSFIGNTSRGLGAGDQRDGNEEDGRHGRGEGSGEEPRERGGRSPGGPQRR